ncbi:MAG: F0F1 ATP synthase subunit delta [Gaiellaceae bacterium]
MSLIAMQGASREALAAAWSEVEHTLESAGADAARLSDELFAVVGVLDDQVALRRALSDPAIDADRKAALADSVLAPHVGSTTLAVVRAVVRSRWSRMRDLGDAMEQLAVLARLVAAARAGQGDEVEDELFRLGRIIEDQGELREALSNPNLPAANKAALVHALLDGKATDSTIALAVQLVTRPRGRKPEVGLAEYGDVAARRTNRSIARVTAASELSDEQRSRLRVALARLYGHDVHLQVELDSQVVGGLVVQVGDEIIDGSIAGRLADARQRLK